MCPLRTRAAPSSALNARSLWSLPPLNTILPSSEQHTHQISLTSRFFFRTLYRAGLAPSSSMGTSAQQEQRRTQQRVSGDSDPTGGRALRSPESDSDSEDCD